MSESDSSARFSSVSAMVFSTAGVAIGLGNIWRFPYMMAEHGGAVFLIAYLFIVIALGIPALMVEWALGRHTRCGPVGAYTKIKMPFGKFVSGLLLLTVLMGASYYGVVLAWVLAMATTHAAAVVSPAAPMTFETLVASHGLQLFYIVVTVFLSCAALFFGVNKGIERLSKIILPLCFVLFVVLICRSLSLEGAMAGLGEYLIPRPEAFKSTTALAAMGQAFFSLGLGGTYMVMYGSYMRSKDAIPKAAVGTAMADVTAALMAGLIIIPAVLALGVKLDAGPMLLFSVMPEVFGTMPAGPFFGALFFSSVFLVALLSLIAAYEVLVVAGKRVLGLPRRGSLIIIFMIQILLSLPALYFEDYIELSDLIWGTTMQPLGSGFAIIALIWCCSRAKVLEEIGKETTLPLPDFLYYWIKFVIPIAIVTMLIYGWKDQIIIFVHSIGEYINP